MRVSVRLGPQADLARLGERPVLDLQMLLAIERTLDALTHHANAQLVPLPIGNVEVRLRAELNALAIHDLVDSKVTLQGVVSGNVVVVRIAVAPHQSAALDRKSVV